MASNDNVGQEIQHQASDNYKTLIQDLKNVSEELRSMRTKYMNHVEELNDNIENIETLITSLEDMNKLE